MAAYDNTNRPVRRPDGAPRRPEQLRSQPQRSGGRPPQRPNNAYAQRPNARRRKKHRVQKRFYAFVAVFALLVIALVLLIAKPFGSESKASPTASAAPTAVPTGSAASAETAVTSEDASGRSSTLAELLANDDSQLEGLTAEQLAQVDDLSVNQGLPSEWMNILLLGSDERTLTESARTDAMIICSINTTTGEVKLTSIMRDLAVNLDDIGANSGTYRINAANYFGGERLAMKVVNECFGMNIEKYVRVNFYGFQQIAQMLGGVDTEITAAEMEEINTRIVEQAIDAYYEGVDESSLPNQLLESYGYVHLDGRQTLAYARIRHTDGGDYARTERQRKVLSLLLEKLDGKGSFDLLSLGTEAMKHMTTNLSVDEIVTVALKVLSADHSNIESLRLPINNSYKQETRNEQDMLYDCDWSANASALYSFIYG